MARIRKTIKGATSFVLMVGDEGAILVQMYKKQVVRRLFAQSADPSHTRGFEEAFDAYPKTPITLLVDMMDQSYIRQTLPPVSSFSISKIVRRRMEKDFSPDDIKGYLILEREKTGRRDWNYLMVSLANPPLLQRWISFATERSNPFRGIGLIPLEAQPFMIATEKKLLLEKGRDAKPLEWQIMVNHHKVGGFRQVVLRGGKLVFTRMAQLVGEAQPAVIAGNIEQEMINTLEYLKRLGLNDPATLSVVVVASEEIKQALDPKNIRAGDYHFFTPFEIAELLELPDAAQPEDHYGDVVTSAFIISRRKLMLLLQTSYTQKLKNLLLYNRGVRALGVLSILSLLGWSAMTALGMYTTRQDTEKAAADTRVLKTQIEDLKVKAKVLPKEINIYTDVVALWRLFDKRRYDPLVLASTLAQVEQDVGLVTTYHWTMPQPLGLSAGGDKRGIEASATIHLTLPHEPVEPFIAGAKTLVDRIQKAFPDYDLSHSELPGLLAETKDLKTVIDDSGTPVDSVSTNVSIENVTVTLKYPGAGSGK